MGKKCQIHFVRIQVAPIRVHLSSHLGLEEGNARTTFLVCRPSLPEKELLLWKGDVSPVSLTDYESGGYGSLRL